MKKRTDVRRPGAAPLQAVALLVLLLPLSASAEEVGYEFVDCERCVCSPRSLLLWSAGGEPDYSSPLDEPLVSDRPDFTEASSTVGRGVLQIEAGYTYTFDEAPGETLRAHTYPELLLRAGLLTNWLELRVGWTYAEEIRTLPGGVRDVDSGAEDLTLGFKIGLTPQEGILPEMALIPQMTVPTGSSEFTAEDEVLPGLIWIYGWEVTDRITTAGQTQLNRALDETTDRPFGLFSQSWTVGYGITDEIGSYIEWFSLIPDGADTERTQHFLNGGFTYLLNDDLQFDIRAGVGLSDSADDYFLGSGFVQRF